MITRHFATVNGDRQVHYRRAGSGPPVVLLHQSPYSSNEHLGLIEDLAAAYTVIAPDTPGNGLSEPLSIPAEAVTMSDYADGLADFLTEIGLERTALYGFHTGSVCALEFSRRHPERVIVAICNGYV